ncbi:hypothetical protein [Nocardioides terrisoli]|uniref:hypothetical protein n=1 Tax=Nocardioides terrisoli TaxID=3388267 RepID=UPI00287B98D2|nr:hypothetical protein [Nocardioides marmorisolisilvae]
MTEDELWDRIEAAIQDVVHIVNDTSIVMRNQDIAEKVQRSLPPGEWVSTETIERMIENYWSVDLEKVEPPDEH